MTSYTTEYQPAVEGSNPVTDLLRDGQGVAFGEHFAPGSFLLYRTIQGACHFIAEFTTLDLAIGEAKNRCY